MSISTLAEFNSFKITFSIKTQTIINVTKKAISLTLMLRRRRRKKRNYSARHLKPFGCENFLPEKNSMVNFIGYCEGWSLVIVNICFFSFWLTRYPSLFLFIYIFSQIKFKQKKNKKHVLEISSKWLAVFLEVEREIF